LIDTEVLEHLEEPEMSLNVLAKILKWCGYGLAAGRVKGPNADHVCLCRNSDKVASDLVKPGLAIVDCIVDGSCSPRRGRDSVC